MLTGDNRATAERVPSGAWASPRCSPEKASKVVEQRASGRKVAMVGGGVTNAPAAAAQADLGVAIGAGTDAAIETTDLALMRCDPL